MNKLRTSLMKHRNLWIFLAIIFAFGLGVGIYFGIESISLFENIISNYASGIASNQTNFSIMHFAVMSVLFISTFFLLGIPLAISYLFYEGMSLGFCFALFVKFYALKGFLFLLLFVLFAKVVFFLLYGIFLSKLLRIGKAIIAWIIYKKSQKDLIFQIALSAVLIILLVLCYDLFFDLVVIKLIRYFGFLLA